MRTYWEFTIDWAKLLLLAFFVIMDGVALVRLSPNADSKDQMIVLVAAILLSVVLIIEFVRKWFLPRPGPGKS